MNDREWLELQNQLHVLREVAEEYPGKTIENIITQLEARRNELGNSAEEQ